ncbi:MAG TPA: homoserine O-succinyltransferase, partial [Dysgonomonas sp.]|nr:homoserine O-succinyltransferase [Dysgonomonas sp.]
NIFVMTQLRAKEQDIRPLKVVIMNLMPLKIATETDLVRLLSNTPLQIEVDFLRLSTHTSKNTPPEHMEEFYKEFKEISQNNYDGLIITGAPVELLEYEDVNYWSELIQVFDWARVHVTSTFYICWAAQAALYHFYGVPKYALDGKLFGVFKHTINDRAYPLFRGFDDEFYAPHSRHTEIRKEDLEKINDIKVLSESSEAGIYIAIGRGGREFYVTGHSEYSLYTLHREYIRDVEKGLNIEVPRHYYKHDDPSQKPISRWTGHGNLLFNNWINYYLYQETPYNLSEIEKLGDIDNVKY